MKSYLEYVSFKQEKFFDSNRSNNWQYYNKTDCFKLLCWCLNALTSCWASTFQSKIEKWFININAQIKTSGASAANKKLNLKYKTG